MTDWKKRLAIVSDEASDSFAEAVAICLPLGIRAYELRGLEGKRFPSVSKETLASILKTVKELELTLVGVSPGFFKHEVNSSNTMHTFQQGFSQAFKVMEYLGVRQMTVFSFKREGGREASIPDRVLAHLQKAKDLCETEGVEMLIENNPAGWANTGANLAYIAKALNAKVVWDPANAAKSGEQAFPNGYQQVRDLIAHIHFKNWTAQADYVDIKDGVVDMVSQIGALKEDVYTGYYTLEPHQWHDRKNATQRNTEQLVELLEHV